MTHFCLTTHNDIRQGSNLWRRQFAASRKLNSPEIWMRKKETKSIDEYKNFYLFSPVVVIPPGKLERLNVDSKIEHSKHLLEEHGLTFPGSPKPHSREKTSQRRKLEAPLLWNKPFQEPIFVLHVTRLLGLELELENWYAHLYFLKLFAELFFTTTI